MSSENVRMANAVNSCLGVIEREAKTVTTAYNTAIMVLTKTLINHDLFIGPGELRNLAEFASTRSGQYSPEGITQATRVIETLLDTSKVNNLEFTMEVLVNTVALTLETHSATLSPKHCDMLGVEPAGDTCFNPSELVDTLIEYYENNPDVKLSEEQANALSRYIDYSNERTVGTIIDHSNTTERYRVNMPVMSDDLSNTVMDLAERMGNGGYRVDKRAWDHLLIYAPPFQKMKKKLKRLKRILKLI